MFKARSIPELPNCPTYSSQLRNLRVSDQKNYVNEPGLECAQSFYQQHSKHILQLDRRKRDEKWILSSYKTDREHSFFSANYLL
jgi:hypothetical protein